MLKWDTALPGWREDRAGQVHGRSIEHFLSSTEGEGESQRACYPYWPSGSRRWQLAISSECLQLTPHRVHSETYLLWVCFQWQQAPRRLSSKLWPAGNVQSPPPQVCFLRHPSATEKPDPQAVWYWVWSCPDAAVTLSGRHLGSLWNPISPSSLHTCSAPNSSLGPASSWASFKETRRRTGFSIEMAVGFTLSIDIIRKVRSGGQKCGGCRP